MDPSVSRSQSEGIPNIGGSLESKIINFYYNSDHGMR